MRFDDVVGVVLAAGRGTRLGGPKALLADRRGTPLAAAHVQAWSFLDRVAVVTRVDIADALRRYDPQLSRHLLISTAADELGPAGSLRAAALQMPEDRVWMVTPVDCPPSCRATTEALLQALRDDPSAAASRPRFDGRGGHPVALRHQLWRTYQHAARPLRDVLREWSDNVVEVPVNDPSIRVDIDTVEDWGRPPVFVGESLNSIDSGECPDETAPVSETQNVGRSVGRVDGAAKVSGAAHYVADIPTMAGELVGATVRSQVARALIEKIELDPAFDWTDVTVVLASDVPENVVQLIVDDQPVLAADRINHRYEPVALVACTDVQKLNDAVRHVKIVLKEQPALFDPEVALAPDAEVIWGEDNVQSRYLITKGEADVAESEAAIDILLSECDVVVEGRYTTHHQEQLYIEPQGMLAWWDDAGVHATGSLQCPYYVHKAFKRCFDVAPDRIHITQAVTGGGFGGKEEYPSIIALHAALLAQKSGRPVRMIYDRTEDIEATTKRHPSVCEISTGCDSAGNLKVLKFRAVFDAGAYVTLTPVELSRGVLHAGGAYKWEHARIEGMSVATNTPPNGAFRGFGAPQTIWAIERHLDRVAHQLGRDPGQLKQQNLLGVGDTTPTGQELRSSVGGVACVEAAFSASGYLRKREEGPQIVGRKARGIGCSIFMHGGGFTGSGERMLKGKVAVDLVPGGGLMIRTASTDIGQGTETIFSQIAADAAGIPIERVSFAVPSTTTVPDSGPTVASRTVMVVGSIVERAAAQVAEKVRAEQGEGGTWDEAAQRLLDREGEVSVLLQYEPPDWVQWDEKAYKGDAYPVYAWMCDVAEVEVDLDTYEVKVIDFWQAADVGKAINPIMCKGQLEGGTLQALGWALCEEVVWDEGRIVNPRMTNYIIPTALDAPPFETMLVEMPYEGGPGGGAKGIGELPMDGGAPAVAAAVEHAIGLVMNHLPLTPERLFVAHSQSKKSSRKSA